MVLGDNISGLGKSSSGNFQRFFARCLFWGFHIFEEIGVERLLSEVCCFACFNVDNAASFVAVPRIETRGTALSGSSQPVEACGLQG